MSGKTKRDFDPKIFLSTIGDGRQIVSFRKKQIIFAQGDATDAVFVVQKGKVRLSAKSKAGKEATLGILNAKDFVGEDCLTGQPLRIASASAMTDCDLLRIEKKAMMLSLHREQTLSDLFVAYLLMQNIRYQEDLIDQHCNSSEKRLARILLLLAKKNTPDSVVPKLDQTTLAQMVGTTRSRVSFFMNRFRSLGLMDYSDFRHGMQIHGSRLSLYTRKNALTLAQN
ncbi:MAG: cyclic nucleotide-binding domain-containing protein [Candidatus Sulfotelmatobacter sp.]|jgi:CRP-like cAMP-binding protein